MCGRSFGHRAHRQDDVLRAAGAAAAALGGDLDDALAGDLPKPVMRSTLFFLKRNSMPFRVRVDDALLAVWTTFQSRVDVADGDAELFRLLDLRPDVGVFEERLRGDAAAVEACTAEERILLDDGHFHAELAGADAGYITARTAADDDHVVLLFSQGKPPVRSRLVCSAPGRRAQSRRAL